MQICIFEDQNIEKLYPLTLTRPVYQLRCGLSDLLTKIVAQLPKNSRIVLHCRDELVDVIKEKFSYPINKLNIEDTIFINGNVLGDKNLAQEIKSLVKKPKGLVVKNKQTLLAKLNKNDMKKFQLPRIFVNNSFLKIVKKEPLYDLQSFNYFWEIVRHNGAMINKEAKLTGKLGVYHTKPLGLNLVNSDNIYLGKNVDFRPGVVLDATQGAIYIDKNVTLLSNSVIMGPVYVGPDSVIKAGAKIYGNTSIGPVSKVGGELEAVIVQGYSNKQHEGFLGHSFLGEWVNLGAGTENSDLKNNYSTVNVLLDKQELDTREQFVGCCLGDHTKTGIKTMINSGSIFGVFCNIFGADYQPKFLPGFSWHNNNKGKEKYQLEKALSMAQVVMERRGQSLTPALKDLYIGIFNQEHGSFNKIAKMPKKKKNKKR